jgi:hypothetical protein
MTDTMARGAGPAERAQDQGRQARLELACDRGTGAARSPPAAARASRRTRCRQAAGRCPGVSGPAQGRLPVTAGILEGMGRRCREHGHARSNVPGAQTYACQSVDRRWRGCRDDLEAATRRRTSRSRFMRTCFARTTARRRMRSMPPWRVSGRRDSPWVAIGWQCSHMFPLPSGPKPQNSSQDGWPSGRRHRS